MEYGFNEKMYGDLIGLISATVYGMNCDRGFFDKLRGASYSCQERDYDEFVEYGEALGVKCLVGRVENRVANVFINDSKDGLDGRIALQGNGKKIARAIHEFSHKYGISTGDLLRGYES